MRPFRLASGWTYLVAVVAAGFVLAVDATVEGNAQIFLGTVAFMFAVLISSAAGGWKPGLLTTILAVCGYIFFFIPPRNSVKLINLADAVPMLGFCVVGAAVSVLCEGLRRARERSDDRQRRLELEIAEHKRAEVALRDAERRKDEFLATLAHELRNPLAPIRNAVEILQLRNTGDTELRLITEIMDRQVQQLIRLIDDLLEVSRITRGKLHLKPERIELAEAIRSALEAANPVIQSANHQLEVDLPDRPILLNADPTRLAQIFTNLVNNAAKYTHQGGRIRITVQKQGAHAVISVKDNGIGIAPEHLAHVFEPFSQISPTLDPLQGGLGIGLSLARKLVELHHGTIEARSAGVGTGSEFIVRLPVLNATTGEYSNAFKQMPAPEAATARVLIADDNPDEVTSLAMMLRQTGFDVSTATDGAEAVAAAEKVQPDAVLLDIGMPKLNGYEAARMIRRQTWGGNMLLIATTGWGQENDKRRAIEAGFDHHLTKPVDLRMLHQLLTTRGV